MLPSTGTLASRDMAKKSRRTALPGQRLAPEGLDAQPTQVNPVWQKRWEFLEWVVVGSGGPGRLSARQGVNLPQGVRQGQGEGLWAVRTHPPGAARQTPGLQSCLHRQVLRLRRARGWQCGLARPARNAWGRAA